MKQSVPEFYARDRQAWRAWLAKNHEIEQSVWLVYDKGKDRVLTWADIVQEALCFGWIDSVAGTVSDTQGKIYVARRKPKSGWSKINKAHVDELLSKNLMQPAGLRAIELAKQNGSWDALNKSDALEYPALLTKLLSQDPQAKKHFEAFTPSASGSFWNGYMQPKGKRPSKSGLKRQSGWRTITSKRTSIRRNLVKGVTLCNIACVVAPAKPLHTLR